MTTMICKLDTCTEPGQKQFGGFCCEQHRRQAQREQARQAQAVYAACQPEPPRAERQHAQGRRTMTFLDLLPRPSSRIPADAPRHVENPPACLFADVPPRQKARQTAQDAPQRTRRGYDDEAPMKRAKPRQRQNRGRPKGSPVSLTQRTKVSASLKAYYAQRRADHLTEIEPKLDTMWRFISDTLSETGKLPTMPDLCEVVGVSDSTVSRYKVELARRGILRREAIPGGYQYVLARQYGEDAP